LKNPEGNTMKSTLASVILALTLSACGSAPDAEIAGSWRLSMDVGVAHGLEGVADFTNGAWSASNPNNAYGGSLTQGDGGEISFWFGNRSYHPGGVPFELRMIATDVSATEISASPVFPTLESSVTLTAWPTP
jgi:opacity protein-like surface antigen